MELQTLEGLQAAVLFVHESMDDSAWLHSSNHCENVQSIGGCRPGQARAVPR